ncbi:MAG: nucleotidyl transferase AbiEii/AbiGii toxin family protein [Candidatus Obscuribacterales bacterium]|nr:nucleotidyl transferase AbiEii/AbiGii toxin family protein [Candidatus Obscuribacterales bacterium]
MNPATLAMIARYNCVTTQDYENAFKEIIQEIALLGLWRAKFFEHAAFYGGTALRILYDLDRFSEDLDFSLLKPQKTFSLSPYLKAIKAELSALDFDVTVEERQKSKETTIESAFIKAGSKEHLLRITVPEELSKQIHNKKLMNIKIEVDTNPPPDFQTEAKILLQPIPFSVRTYQMPDLFATKIHALLERRWKERIKGRDLYDFVWYIGRNVPVRLKHIEARLRQSGTWKGKASMKQADIHELLEAKFETINIKEAKKDISPFIRDPASIELWSRDFIQSLLSNLEVI